MSGLTPRVALLLVIPPLMWASNAVVGRWAMLQEVPPLGLNALRWALAGLLLLPLAWHVLRSPHTLIRHWRYLSLIGLLGVGMYNALQYLALQTSTPINVTLIAASTPVWMLAVGSLFYGQHPSGRELLGTVLSLAGVACVMARGDVGELLALRLVVGDLYVLIAVIAWAFYSWMLVRPPASYVKDRPDWDWAQILLVQIIFGLIWAGSGAGLEWAVTEQRFVWSPSVVALLFYVAIGPSILAYRCWGLGVAAAGPAMAGFFANLAPVFAAVMSVLLLGELPRGYHVLAFALIVLGIVVSSGKKTHVSR